MELNTTLLREKFTLTDMQDPQALPIIATSNRIPLVLRDGSNQISESFVIRAQNMHSAIRMTAQILQSFMRVGPLLARAEKFPFDEVWERICTEHEVLFNPQRWVVVYNKGKVVFSSGEYHTFLDVIEKCDSINPGNYDRAVHIAEETFLKMGKKLSIGHEANIGMVVNVKSTTGRCGLILRNPFKSTTFNFIAESKDGSDVSPMACLSACAAFLEGIQLAVRVGMINEKLRADLIDRKSPEVKEVRSALPRIAHLNAAVSELEERLTVHYRPERPEFHDIVKEAENFQRKLQNVQQF